MALAAARQELRITLRNGEQLLLAVVIPLAALLGMTLVPIGGIDEPRVDTVTPGVLALAVMSSAFTSQAITTGFDRRYGVLKRLGATPLPRWGLIAAKTGCVLTVELGQVVVLALVAALLGWQPHAGIAAAVLLLVVGTAAFSGLGLLMAGTLRAEATLAGANLVWLLLFAGGGIIVPLAELPDRLAAGLALLPSAALTEGLRDVLQHGAGLPLAHLGVLLVWAALGVGLAARTFRWE
jgi:ABC-2 type transport system permease protein